MLEPNWLHYLEADADLLPWEWTGPRFKAAHTAAAVMNRRARSDAIDRVRQLR